MSHSKEEIEKIRKLEEFLNLYEDSYINNLISERGLKKSINLHDNFDERYDKLKNSKNKKFPSSYYINSSKYKLLICPNCEISGKGLRFFKLHFENCVFKNHDLQVINQNLINTQNPYSIISKYKLSTSQVYNYVKFHKLIDLTESQRVCPHCEMKLNRGSIRFHYSNCKLKGQNLDLFKNELSKLSVTQVSKKYKLSRTFINHCIQYFSINKNNSVEEDRVLNKNICPHCKQSTNNSNKRFHYKNCQFKYVDIYSLKTELNLYSDYYLNKKYNIPRKSIKTFRLFHSDL